MTKLTYHPYLNEKIEITFTKGESLEFATLNVGGVTKKYDTQALSLGVVERLSNVQWLEGEENYFAVEVYSSLVNNTPLNEQVAYSIKKAHVDGFPNAAEALTLLSDFYQFKFDYHTLRYWADAVNVNSSLLES
jgi:hypothetical protein